MRLNTSQSRAKANAGDSWLPLHCKRGRTVVSVLSNTELKLLLLFNAIKFLLVYKKNATYLVSLTLSFFFKFFFFSRSFDFKRLSGFKEVFKSAAVTRGSPSLFVCQLLCVAAPSGARGDCVTSNRCIPGDTSTSDSVIATNPFRRVHIFIYKPSAVALQNWTGNI